MLIFFDIDGTLISEDKHEMPDSAREAVLRAREQGHICIVNTGRSKKLVERDMYRLDIFDGFLMGCGTMISLRDRVYYHQTFTKEMGQRIIDGLRKYHIDAVLEGAENNYNDTDENYSHEEFIQFIHHFEAFHYGSLEEAPGRFDKFYCYTDDINAIRGFMEEFSDELSFVDRKHHFYEIMPKGCSKAEGMKRLAQILNVSMEDTAAIGDSSNDIDMLACAGYGIAMGNATDDVKAVAKYVTTDLEKDGIANALKWLEEL